MGFLSYLKKTYHRNLLEKLLFKNKNRINGKILDIGSKNRRYDSLFNGEITAIDIVPKPEFNVIKGNLTNLDFEQESFDSILCLEVFTYLDVNDIKKGFNEIYRVLKKKGQAIISMSYIYAENDENFRLTQLHISKILSEIKGFKFKIFKIGNKYTSIYDMFRDRIKNKKSRILINIALASILFIYYMVLKLISLDQKIDTYPEGYFILCQKI
ncbi:MAG: class I SAM-dependent methyltransferase [Candidatus Hermodarchaeota archaeon]